MGSNFLIREIGVAVLGGLGVWALQITPLQDSYKQLLQGGITLATLAVMAHIGGLF